MVLKWVPLPKISQKWHMSLDLILVKNLFFSKGHLRLLPFRPNATCSFKCINWLTSINPFLPKCLKKCGPRTGRPVDEISEYLLFTVIEGGHFRFRSLLRPLVFFHKYLKLPKIIVQPYMPKVGHGIMDFVSTIWYYHSPKDKQSWFGGMYRQLHV